MTHEHWRQYTKKEIDKIKKEKCVKCPYVSGPLGSDKNKVTNWDAVTCNYICIAHERRGVRPEDCQHYKDKIK